MLLPWSAFVLMSSALVGLGFQEYLHSREKQRESLYGSATTAQLWALRLLGWTTSSLLVWIQLSEKNGSDPNAPAVIHTSLSFSGLLWDVWSLLSLGWCTLHPKPELKANLLSAKPLLWGFGALSAITSEGFVQRYWFVVVPVSIAFAVSSLAIVAQLLMSTVPGFRDVPQFIRRYIAVIVPTLSAAASSAFLHDAVMLFNNDIIGPSLALGCAGLISGLVALEILRRGVNSSRLKRPFVMVLVALILASAVNNQGIGLSTIVLSWMMYALAVEGKVLPRLPFAFFQTLGLALPLISIVLFPSTLPYSTLLGALLSSAPAHYACLAEIFAQKALTFVFVSMMTALYHELLEPLVRQWLPSLWKSAKEKSHVWVIKPMISVTRNIVDKTGQVVTFIKPKVVFTANITWRVLKTIGSVILRGLRVVWNVVAKLANLAKDVFLFVSEIIWSVLDATYALIKWVLEQCTRAMIRARDGGLKFLSRVKGILVEYVVNPLKRVLVPIKDAVVELVIQNVTIPLINVMSKVRSIMIRRKSLLLGTVLCYCATYEMYEDLSTWRVPLCLMTNAGLAVALHTFHSNYDFKRQRSEAELLIPPWEGAQNISLVFVFYVGRVGYSAFKAYGLSPKPEDVLCAGDVAYLCVTAAVSAVLFCFQQILREALNDANPYPENAHYREYIKSCSLGLALVRAATQLVPLLASHRLFLLFLLTPASNRCSSMYFALRFVLVSLISVPSGLLIFIPWLLMPLRSDQPLEGIWGYSQPLFNKLLGRNWNDFNAVVGLSCCAVGVSSLFSFHPLNLFICAGACSHGLYLLCLHFPWSRPLQQFSRFIRRSFQYSQPIISLVASLNFAHAAFMTCRSRESNFWVLHAVGFGVAAIETLAVAMMLYGNIAFYPRIGAEGRVLFDFVLHFRRATFRIAVRAWHALRKYRHSFAVCWEAVTELTKFLILPVIGLLRAGLGIIWRNAVLSWISSLGLLVMLYKCYQWGLDEAVISFATFVVEKAYSLVPSALTLTLSSLKTIGAGAAEISKSIVLEVAVNWVHELESGHLLHSSTFAWWSNLVFHTCALFRLQYRAEAQSVPLIFVPLLAASVAWALGQGTVLVAIVVSGHWVLLLSHWSNFARSLQDAYLTSNRGQFSQERQSRERLAVEAAKRYGDKKQGIVSFDLDDCIICVEPLRPEPENASSSAAEGIAISVLPCGHPFHCDCIAEWLKTKLQCPICRREVPVT